MSYGPTDRAVRLNHALTPQDVERIVDALEVDGIRLVDAAGADARVARITAALCGGTESDYE